MIPSLTLMVLLITNLTKPHALRYQKEELKTSIILLITYLHSIVLSKRNTILMPYWVRAGCASFTAKTQLAQAYTI